SPLPNADAWRAGELDLPAGAFNCNVRPGFGSARPVRAVRTQHIGEDGDRVVALEGDEGGRFTIDTAGSGWPTRRRTAVAPLSTSSSHTAVAASARMSSSVTVPPRGAR